MNVERNEAMPAPAKMKPPSQLQIWLRAVRVPALIGTIIPVLLGGGLALIDRGFEGWTFLAVMIAVMLVQAGSNLFNDYFDYHKGADDETSLTQANPLRKGWLKASHVYLGGWICYLAAALVGYYIVSIGDWLMLLFGVIGLLLGYLYTGTRFALAYHGLGELSVFIVMGPLIVLGTYYAMVKILYGHVILNALPFGLLAAAVVHAKNLRDLEHDRQIGKRTLATFLGERKAKWEFYLLLLLSYLTMIGIWLLGYTPLSSLLVLITLPLAWKTVTMVAKSSDPMELNIGLGLAVLLQLLFGILNVFGIFLYYFLQL
ncbi:1,4-dihydroxy-2-naphthoate octaprenyltransferase [Tumebacillus algifaecis]|uniref:1,4-dihydroxy-2-naphthoate octaprenyltransferase n=1 Tax=Tumebacillus algifaecis TaxID=1214604 RepID=A0A223D410_9BACL|nr:1,4-dihydroxy-2-naphthoate octaprenyltransferase [Tumebacillus algifaecis]ASS76321.1 1,4-dihydroxy-2-naphthoate octaprenyltransferase [Tumebacillus algifaecis]